jgi:hypothetical protein
VAITILNRYTGSPIITLPVATLNGFNFGGLNITNGDFSPFPDLRNAVFAGSVTPGCNFHQCDVRGASFFRGNIQGSDITGVTRDATTNWHCSWFENMVLDLADQNVSAWALPVGDGGQSNAQGNSAGAIGGLPDNSIPFYYANPPNGNSGGVWGPLVVDASSGFHAAEIRFAQTIKALGYDVGICKITRGATTMSDWAYNAVSEWVTTLQPNLTAAVNLMQTVWPGKFSRWSWRWYLGEDDSRAVGAGASLYGDNLRSYLRGVSGIVGNNVENFLTIVRTQSWLNNAIPNSIGNCRYWETLLSNANIENVDDLQTGSPDNVHLTAAMQDVEGATRWNPAWLARLAQQVP